MYTLLWLFRRGKKKVGIKEEKKEKKENYTHATYIRNINPKGAERKKNSKKFFSFSVELRLWGVCGDFGQKRTLSRMSYA